MLKMENWIFVLFLLYSFCYVDCVLYNMYYKSSIVFEYAIEYSFQFWSLSYFILEFLYS